MKKIYLIILFVLLMSFLPFQKAFALNSIPYARSGNS